MLAVLSISLVDQVPPAQESTVTDVLVVTLARTAKLLLEVFDPLVVLLLQLLVSSPFLPPPGVRSQPGARKPKISSTSPISLATLTSFENLKTLLGVLDIVVSCSSAYSERADVFTPLSPATHASSSVFNQQVI